MNKTIFNCPTCGHEVEATVRGPRYDRYYKDTKYGRIILTHNELKALHNRYDTKNINTIQGIDIPCILCVWYPNCVNCPALSHCGDLMQDLLGDFSTNVLSGSVVIVLEGKLEDIHAGLTLMQGFFKGFKPYRDYPCVHGVRLATCTYGCNDPLGKIRGDIPEGWGE